MSPPVLGKPSQLGELFCVDTNNDFPPPPEQAWRANIEEPVYINIFPRFADVST